MALTHCCFSVCPSVCLPACVSRPCLGRCVICDVPALQMRPDLYDVLPDASGRQLEGVQEHAELHLSADLDWQRYSSRVPAATAAAAEGSCASHEHQQQLPHLPSLPGCAIMQMHYSQSCRLLAVVFADGAAALYSPAEEGHLLTAQLDFRRWLCTPDTR